MGISMNARENLIPYKTTLVPWVLPEPNGQWLNYQLYEKGFTPLYSGSLQRCLRLVIDSGAKPKRNVETNNYFPMSQIFLLRLILFKIPPCSKSHLVQNLTLLKIPSCWASSCYHSACWASSCSHSACCQSHCWSSAWLKVPTCSNTHLAQTPILLSLFLFPICLLKMSLPILTPAASLLAPSTACCWSPCRHSTCSRGRGLLKPRSLVSSSWLNQKSFFYAL